MPLLRDSHNSFKPFERFFANLTTGMVFGELSLIEDRKRFYNAIAMTEVCYLQIDKEEYKRVIET